MTPKKCKCAQNMGQKSVAEDIQSWYILAVNGGTGIKINEELMRVYRESD